MKNTTNERIEELEKDFLKFKDIIEYLQSEIKDLKDAFEHNDDSLQRVRTTVDTISGANR